MRFNWKDVAMAVGGGLLFQHVLGSSGSSLPEPIVRERFVRQPMAVYIERVVWQLTRDFDIRNIRNVRNFLAERQSEVEECYRQELPPDEVAKRVERTLLGELDTIAPRLEQPSVQGVGVSEPTTGVTSTT